MLSYLTMYILIFTWFTLFCTQCLSLYSPRLIQYPVTGNTGEPVFVTPFIEEGKLVEGRNASFVKAMKGNVTSYAGFFTVKDTDKYKSNMFFWFFPSESGQSAPVVLWLQGGPGASSLYGLFEENGPFYVRPKRGLKLRKYSWTKTMNVLYIDNPVGTGFSFTTSDDGYSKSETDVSENLLIAVTQFFALFPYLQKNDFYVTGESYGGKYVPALAYAIDKSNSKQRRNALKINLKGIAVGNGLCDPEHMLVYGDYLYQLGLIDSNGREQFQQIEKSVVDLIQKRNYELAFKKFDILLNGDLTPYKTLFYNLTGFTYYFNYRYSEDDSTKGDFSKFIQSDLARRSIHVGDKVYHNDSKVEQFLMGDVMQSVKPLIEALLKKKYRILFYNGQLDIIVAYPLTVNFIKSLDWPGKDRYSEAQRHILWVDNRIAGYYKQVDTLTEVLVRDAGHMVPKDQPLWALELISRFTYNKPW